jgi:hypothetical protein
MIVLRAKTKKMSAARGSMKTVREFSLEEIEEIKEIARNQFSADHTSALAAIRGREPRPDIADPGPDPTDREAIAHQCDMLIRAYEVSRRHPDKHRLAAMFALKAVLNFIMRSDELRAPKLMSCLLDLWAALVDLERGAEPSLLKLKPKRSRRPDSSDREMMKGAAAAAMSLLMKIGQTREEAARRVANELCRNGVKLGGHRQLRWGTVASWRDQARRASPSADGASFTYRLLIDGGTLVGMPTVAANMRHEQRERVVREVLLALSSLAKHQN